MVRLEEGFDSIKAVKIPVAKLLRHRVYSQLCRGQIWMRVHVN